MSMLRAAALQQKRAVLLALPRRAASTSTASAVADHHDDHHDHEDTTVYPPETFSSRFLGRFLVVTLGVVAWWKFAPSPQEETLVGKLVKHYKEDADAWSKINSHHMLQSADVQQGILLVADAKVPPVHRYRFPQGINQASPFLQRVGTQADMSDLVVKTSKQ